MSSRPFVPSTLDRLTLLSLLISNTIHPSTSNPTTDISIPQYLSISNHRIRLNSTSSCTSSLRNPTRRRACLYPSRDKIFFRPRTTKRPTFRRTRRQLHRRSRLRPP